MAFKKVEKAIEIEVLKVEAGAATVRLVGTTPLIYNCMSEKARRELLFPEKKTRASRETTMKHDPVREYRDSIYHIAEGSAPTSLGMPNSAFKGALEAAAKRIPGVVGEDVKQLISVDSEHMYGNLIPVYGVPQLLMSVVRNAGFTKTPDIRTRAIVPKWCCEIRIRFIKPQLGEQAIGNLISAAGIFVGIGDFRQEKGAGNYGLFSTGGSAAEFAALVKSGGRAAQQRAIEAPTPQCYDVESERLLSWFLQEVVKRDRQKQLKDHAGSNGAAAARRRKPAAEGARQ